MQNAYGKAFVFGDDINTDVILPGAYLNVTDPKELASHCMESEDPDFVKNAQPGDIMIAQKNFGCGSSREHAPLSIKYGAHAATHSPPLLLWRRATRAGRRGRGGQRTATKGTAHIYATNSPRRDTRTTKGGGSTPPPRAHLAREALSSRGGYRRERRLSMAQISKSRM